MYMYVKRLISSRATSCIQQQVHKYPTTTVWMLHMYYKGQPPHTKIKYRMGTNFRGWLNFAVFEGNCQSAKNNHGEIFCEATPTQEYTPSLGKTSLRMALFRYFRTTTDHWRETPHVGFLRYHLFTDPRVPLHNLEKGITITPITNLRKLKPSKF